MMTDEHITPPPHHHVRNKCPVYVMHSIMTNCICVLDLILVDNVHATPVLEHLVQLQFLREGMKQIYFYLSKKNVTW